MSIYRGRNRKDFSLASALYDAISDYDFRGVQYILVEKGADPTIVLPNSGISPFHLIVGNNSNDFALQVTNLILQNGASPNIQSDDGLTPLHIAAAWGRLDIVKLLISCGADPDIKDYNWFTCLDYAIEYKHYDTENFLRNVMYNNITLCNDDKENYVLVLEKIIISNGHVEGEYEENLENENSYNFDTSLTNLQQLPQAAPNDYVRHWCRKHAKEHDDCEFKIEQTVKSEFKDECCSDSANTRNSYSPSPGFLNSNRGSPNKNVIENFSLEYEPSVKYLLKICKRDADISNLSFKSKFTDCSRESGIVTLPDTISDRSSVFSKDVTDLKPDRTKLTDNLIKPQDTSSDYFTCNENSGSTNILEQNICGASLLSSNQSSDLFENNSTKIVSICESLNKISLTQPAGSIDTSVANRSFSSITEVYKYVDNKEGIVLFENRLVTNKKSEEIEEILSSSQSLSSKLSSLPTNFDYDTDTLKRELTNCGFLPGPITKGTKRVYLRKLRNLQRHHRRPQIDLKTEKKVYSAELEKTLKNSKWNDNLTEYKAFEELIFKEFSNPDSSRKWREGTNKSSFTYLLLDPRITNNLPVRSETMSPEEVWNSFVSSIFYVGKGKRSRPYSHLYDAVLHWKEGNKQNYNKKLQHILDIWNDDCGVVCLHVFQNVIPVEAYTREAAMIAALKIENIKNLKTGDYYGVASTWSKHQQKTLGVLLLYKAMLIFLNEGERQLRPADIN